MNIKVKTPRPYKSVQLIAWVLCFSYASSVLATDIRPSCNRLRQDMRSLQASQFDLKDEGKTLFELTKEHDSAIAELAIIEGIKNLKADFQKHRDNLLSAPLQNLKESILKLDEGRLVAGRMAAVESFIGQLKTSPEFPAVIDSLKATKGTDPTSNEVIMDMALKECSAQGSIPLFCTILNEEDKRASGIISTVKSIVTSSETRPIRKTLEEFSKTYQVIGANVESSEISAEKLSEFENMLKDGEGIAADAYHGKMEELLTYAKTQSQLLAIDVNHFERCTAQAQAQADTQALSKCEFSSDNTKEHGTTLLNHINEQLSKPEMATQHRISLQKLKKDLEAVQTSRGIAQTSREKALALKPEDKEAYNNIAKSAMDKMSYIYATLKKRNIQGTVEQYFKNEDKGGDSNQIALENFSHVLSEISPQCGSIISSKGSLTEVSQEGVQLSSCLAALTANQQQALDSKASEAKQKVAAAKGRIDKIKASQDYLNFDKLKTFTARSYVSGDSCTSEGGNTEYIHSCTDKTGIDLGFNTISRLTDSAGQILAEYQAAELGEVETRDGARQYSTELAEVCKSAAITKAAPRVCNTVSIYHEAAHTPTKSERNQELIRDHNIVYDVRTRKHTVTKKQPVITHPIVIEAATKNILGVGSAFIQGRQAYDASLMDGTNRLNMAWTNYYLNQYYYYNSPFFAGGYSLGGYPFALTSGSSIPDTSTYYSIQ